MPGTAARRVTLALDASTALGSVAVLQGRALVAEVDVPLRGRDTERLMPAVAEALRLAGMSVSLLDAVACGAGPGSFTGLRIAGAIAKGLAVSRGIPLFPVETHLLLVLGVRPALAPGRYVALLDAMRGERFARDVVVDSDGSARCAGAIRLVSATVAANEALDEGVRRVGAGEDIDATPRARGVAALIEMLAAADAAQLEGWEPLYGRQAEAQVRWEAAHGRALA